MMYSNETPFLIKGDINKDAIDEIYVGGGKDQQGAFIHFKSGKFESEFSKDFGKYSLSEETKGALFDVDSDGDLDIYWASGGRFFPPTSSVWIDKIFLNNGKGEFTESPNPLPFTYFVSTSVAEPIDFDQDGDLDILVGERFDPFAYGKGGRGFLLENNGKGLFKDVTKEFAPDLLNIGMVTDLLVVDYNSDGRKDVVLVGDWMPITMLKNANSHFVNSSSELGLKETEGWWRNIETSDFNKDGKPDFVVANHGRNTFFKPGDRMYVNDFDRNGSVEQIFCTKIGERYFPIVDKDEFLSQLPSMKKELIFYKNYARRSITELFPEEVLKRSKIFEVKLFSSILILSGTKGYVQVELPLEAQYSPLYSLLISDFDKDGVEDLIAGGNQYQVKPQFGRYDASNGWFFKGILSSMNRPAGQGKQERVGQFSFERGQSLNVQGQIRDMEFIEVNETKYILFAKYDGDLEIYKTQH